MSKPRVLGLVGPTASGKSALALLAAKELRGEIVCMDSMQVYRGLDIGTSKPGPAEQALVPHHLLDVAEPDAAFTVVDYHHLATEAIAGILSRGGLPVLCGGTGLYLRALSGGLDFGGAPADEALRARYHQMAIEQGNEAVHALLKAQDPATAARLHPNNLRRVIRALEVLAQTGSPLSARQAPAEADSPYDVKLFALDWPRETLYGRVDARAKWMLENGLEAEVRGLLQAGVPPEAQSMQGLGYKELVPLIRGEQSQGDTLELLSRRTRNYAKRQLTWFRPDGRVRWLSGQNSTEEHLQAIRQAMGAT